MSTAMKIPKLHLWILYIGAFVCIHMTYSLYEAGAFEPKSTPVREGGETALCNDGTYSFSKTRTGTCYRNNGVAQWFKEVGDPKDVWEKKIN